MNFLRSYEAWGHQWYAVFKKDDGTLIEWHMSSSKDDLEAIQNKLEDILSRSELIPYDPLVDKIDKSVLANFIADIKSRTDNIDVALTNAQKLILIVALIKYMRSLS